MQVEEIIARAVAADEYAEATGVDWDFFVSHARSVIAALDAAGFVIVPREPTPEMRLAANRAQAGADGFGWYSTSVSAWERGHKAVVAMLAARPDASERGKT